MKHIIILGDGMADHPIAKFGNKTLLQHANTPNMDRVACEGRCGLMQTIPQGFEPGSEVANTAILGYDLNEVYEGRGPLEAASIGYEMNADDFALRCNIISLADGKIKNHHGGHLTTDESAPLIAYLDEALRQYSAPEGEIGNVRLFVGIQYRHLMVIKGGNKHIICTPPHDHPEEEWAGLLVKPDPNYDDKPEPGRMTARATADLINKLILKSQELLSQHQFNQGRKHPANSIWPWGGGYRPAMLPLRSIYPTIKTGVVISAVDLIRGIGHYAGLDIVKVPGATGLYNTNYAGKVAAAIDALKKVDFVFLHIEASDEAGHDGDVALKQHTIEDLDSKVVGPILDELRNIDEDVCVAIMPDHPTPVEKRIHMAEPVPFAIWHKGIQPDSVQAYDEVSMKEGVYGTLRLQEFMKQFMSIE